MAKYVLSVDQSTQGTKALIFDEVGKMLARADLPHRQIVNELGWVSHDPEEIYQNTLKVVRMAAEKAGIDPADIACMGISNQRETTVAWDKNTGKPVWHLRRFFSFVGLYQSWQGFFGKVHIPYGSIHIRKYLQPAAGAFYSFGPDLPAVFIRFCGVQAA